MNDPLPALEFRSRVLQGMRSFFIAEGYLEVETPVRIPAPAMELHIDVQASGDHFLRTSPELHMKRLLAAGAEKIFQLGPCFRSGERGRIHHPEFTLLEWYRAGAGYLDMMDETQRLLARLAEGLNQASAWWAEEWLVLDVADQFRRHADWDPVAAFDADRFDLDLVQKVEPRLPGQPVALTDYPAELGAMARRKPGLPEVAERWELYLAGVEIANAYSELCDAEEQRARFEAWREQRAELGRPLYPVDEPFLEALAGMPEAGGVALGVDRLVMVLLGAGSLDEILPFRD